MYQNIPYRTGDEEALAAEFIKLTQSTGHTFDVAELKEPELLMTEDILAVHYANSGAQGEGGAVEILYRTSYGVRFLYGNYAYGQLNLDAVIEKLPMLGWLDDRHSMIPPYPFGGHLSVPDGWAYCYMGALNHFFVRKAIADRFHTFINIVYHKAGGWEVFNAIAWVCGARFAS